MTTTKKLILLTATLALSATMLFACNVNVTSSDNGNTTKVKGTGDIIAKTLTLDKFTMMEIEGQGDIKVTYGPTQQITIKAQKNILELLEFSVKSGKLVVSTKSNYSISSSKGVDIEIITPNAITSYSISGAADINISGKPQKSLNVEIAGAAKLDAYSLEVENVTIDIAGAADCNVKASKTLNVDIAGTGNVSYKGSPTVTKSIAGIGSVKQEKQ
jgi:hypothetical protein